MACQAWFFYCHTSRIQLGMMVGNVEFLTGVPETVGLQENRSVTTTSGSLRDTIR